MPLTLLFDLDGTLTDSAPGITRCIAHALDLHGIDPVPEARLRACVGPPLFESFRALSGGDDRVESLVAAYRARYVEIGMFENVVYDGIETMLDALIEQGVSLHVVTAKPEPYAEQVLAHFDLRRRFGRVFGPALEGAHTTKSELIAASRRELGLDPATTVMVGDRDADMIAAADHDVSAWGVRWGYGSDEELLGAGAAALVDAPAHLADLVAEFGR